MTKRYGMEKAHQRRQKAKARTGAAEPTPRMASIYENIGKMTGPYKYKSKWGVTAKAAAKDVVSPFSIIKGKLKNDPLGQND